MKWIVLVLCIVGVVTGELTTIDGGNNDQQVCRTPFYHPQLPLNVTAPQCGSITINMYSPVNGATYYIPNIMLNFSVIGAEDCYYSSGGGYNLINCFYNETRTFQTGSVTLTLYAENTTCNSTAQVSFYVTPRNAGGDIQEDTLVFIPLFGLLLLFLFSRKKQKIL